MIISTWAEEASSFSSSAKDRGGRSSPSLSPITSFRIALKTKRRHTTPYECTYMIN